LSKGVDNCFFLKLDVLGEGRNDEDASWVFALVESILDDFILTCVYKIIKYYKFTLAYW
jgi:hypothetical protein